MTVQESGVAVGWPLNLGHNTTGWPLGLRLRLIHEDLQWPTMSEQLALSTSGVSTDSSSLDTMSTKSFFQDKSMSLGALMGLPFLDTAGNRHQRFQQLQHQAFLSPTAPSNTPTIGPVQTGNRTVKSRPIPHRHRLGRSPIHQHQLENQLSTRSTVGSPSAASLAGWCLLSLLSCARVPASIGSSETEAGETVIPRAQLVARQVHPSSAVQDLELEVQEKHEGPGAPPPPMISQHHMSSLARKLYDNITFEDEELEMSTKRNSNSELSSDGSKEWNPLFSSSPRVARDDEEQEVNDESREVSGPIATPCDHSFELSASCNTAPLMTLMRTSGKDSDALLRNRKDVDSKLKIGCSTSTTFCINVKQWQQKQQEKQEQQQQLSQEMCEALVDPLINQNRRFMFGPARDSPRNKILSAFVSRMVCCLSTPTRGSSIS